MPKSELQLNQQAAECTRKSETGANAWFTYLFGREDGHDEQLPPKRALAQCFRFKHKFGSKEDSSGKDRQEPVVSAASEGGKPIECHFVHYPILNPKVFLTPNRFLLLAS
jgi:hypothetical protein